LYIKHIVETWKEFDANELTHSAAHHLMAIDELGAQYGGWARVSDIARHLGITRGSVSINLRALKKRGLVESDEHHMVRLLPVGQKIVHRVKAKKAAVKAFLCEVLNLPQAQAEIDACKIEHLLSQSTGEQLVSFVRFVLSEDEAATELLARFRARRAECAGTKTCPVCKDQCLLEELQLTS
jgi:Mn-dependent DtxR family transcriptional regulator